MTTNDDLIEQMARGAYAASPSGGEWEEWEETPDDTRSLWCIEAAGALDAADPVELAAHAVERIIADRGWTLSLHGSKPSIDNGDSFTVAADVHSPRMLVGACLTILTLRAQRRDPIQRLRSAGDAIVAHATDHAARKRAVELVAAVAAVEAQFGAQSEKDAA